MTMKRLSLHALSQTRKNSLIFIYIFLLIACSKADREQDDNAVQHRVKVSKTKSGMTITSELNAAGQKDGSEVICYSNNALFASRRFKSGLRVGRTVTFFMPNYFTKPLTVHEIIYFKNDKQDGKFYSFYENGKIEYLQRWRNGNIRLVVSY